MVDGKPIVWVDMDDTAVNFSKQARLYSKRFPSVQYPQSLAGFFSTMEPMPGFIESWEILSQHFDMRFLTRPSMYNAHSYTEKALWVRDNMGGIKALEKLFLAPDKSIVKGDYLIDDWDVHGQPDFEGEFIRFGPLGKFKKWEGVTEYLLGKISASDEEKYGEYGFGYCKKCGKDLCCRLEFMEEKCEECI